jgi:AcrR family transcriptional regulator
VITPGPGRRSAEHAQSQRTRILDAAQKCFVESGFHAATMATIAETAQVSAGLIYRYFPGKDAIVLAIIERELQVRRARIATLQSPEELVARLVETFRELRANEPGILNAVLYLEMSAEGTRAPQIAAAIRQSDAETRDGFRAWLARAPGEGGLGLAPKDADAQALLMQLLVEGMAVRAAREPGLPQARLRQTLEPFLQLTGLRERCSAARRGRSS